MMQVTNEMVSEACFAYQTKGTMRAALEAALAVRESDAGEWAAFGASDAACHKWPDDTPEHKALRAAYIEGAAEQADLIEQQAKEIERLKMSHKLVSNAGVDSSLLALEATNTIERLGAKDAER